MIEGDRDNPAQPIKGTTRQPCLGGAPSVGKGPPHDANTRMSEENMHLRRAQPFMEWNLNTIITVAGFLIMLFLYAGKSGQLVERLDNIAKNQDATAVAIASLSSRVTAAESDIRDEKSWRSSHEATNRDRRGEIEGSIASLNTQTDAIDQRVNQVEALGARQSDQQSATNARLGEIGASVRDLQKSVTDIQTDQKVILNYIDEQRAKTKGSPR